MNSHLRFFTSAEQKTLTPTTSQIFPGDVMKGSNLAPEVWTEKPRGKKTNSKMIAEGWLRWTCFFCFCLVIFISDNWGVMLTSFFGVRNPPWQSETLYKNLWSDDIKAPAEFGELVKHRSKTWKTLRMQPSVASMHTRPCASSAFPGTKSRLKFSDEPWNLLFG